MKRHVLMLLSNGYRPDPRVENEASALVEAGYRVTILCWDRTGKMAPTEDANGIAIRRVGDIRSTYGAGWRQLRHLPRFWKRAVQEAESLAPEVVHCHDLDTLYAGRSIKRRLGARLVYDAHECYPMNMALYLPGLMVQPLHWWEFWLLRDVDVSVAASDALRDYLIAKRDHPVFTIGNYANIYRYGAVADADIEAARAESGVPTSTLLVAYIAGFSRNRIILPFIEAAALLPHVEFRIWGGGVQADAVQAASENLANVQYCGWAEPEDLPALLHAVDVIYYGLRTDYPGAEFNSPNTMFQAMAAGKPMIVTRGGELGRVVQDERCGIVIDEATPEAIAGAIEMMADGSLRAQLGANGRSAAAERFNLAEAQGRLVSIYDSHLVTDVPE